MWRTSRVLFVFRAWDVALLEKLNIYEGWLAPPLLVTRGSLKGRLQCSDGGYQVKVSAVIDVLVQFMDSDVKARLLTEVWACPRLIKICDQCRNKLCTGQSLVQSKQLAASIDQDSAVRNAGFSLRTSQPHSFRIRRASSCTARVG